MTTLRVTLEAARTEKRALGHFNVSEMAAFKAVVACAKDLGVPLLIGVSEGEREFIGVREIASLVRAVREETGLPIFLNADHTHSLAKVEEAARAGFDEILFDGSRLSFEENIKQTKEAVAIVRAINPEIVIEGEIGYIGSSSEILESLPEGVTLDPATLTTPEEAKQFVQETGIDVLAPAVGNMHGLLRSMVHGNAHKELDIQRIVDIGRATGVYMTLHGGSGTADTGFIAAVRAGIAIVHVSTELRVAWREGVEEGLRIKPEEVAPYKILPEAVDRIQTIVANRLKLFNGL